MASSLSSQCTPLKQTYDACFNAWFEGYLEPTIAAASGSQATYTSEQRVQYSRVKAAAFDEKCGDIWKSYKECVQKAVKEKGLDALLDQARDENPLKEQPAPIDADHPSSGR